MSRWPGFDSQEAKLASLGANGRRCVDNHSVFYRLNYTPGRDFAVAEVTALLSHEIVDPVLQDLGARTRADGTRRLLISLLDVPGVLDEAEHYLMGVAVAKHLGHLEKVATLVPEEKVTRVSEDGARDEGMQLRVFASLGSAEAWLRRAT